MENDYGIELRSIELAELRAEQTEADEHIVEGYAAVYESPANIGGDFTETIAKGAFSSTDLKDVFMTTNHDRQLIPIARSRNNNENSTLQLMADDVGLHFRARLDPKNPRAEELFSAVKRGDITGMSVAMVVARDGDRWENINSVFPSRTITRVERIIEISAVTHPAYDDTSISCRSLENARQALESEKKKAAIEELRSAIFEKLGEDL